MDYMLKCRALYLRSIALLFRSRLVVDNDFLIILDNFLEKHYWDYKEMFDLIYSFDDDDNKDENTLRDNLLLKKYLLEFTISDKAIKLYEDIGFENISMISELACLFCEYYYELLDIGNIRVRS